MIHKVITPNILKSFRANVADSLLGSVLYFFLPYSTKKPREFEAKKFNFKLFIIHFWASR